jgi:MFS family permease
MVEVLHVGFLGVTLHAVTSSLARTVAAPFWGRAMDRFGARPVLVVSATGIGLVSLSWVAASPSCMWILAIDAVLAGALDAGQMLGSMTLPLRVSPRERLPFYLAAFGMASGLVFGLASITGGAIASALPERISLLGLGASSYALLFAGSSVLRGVAALLATRIAEPGARSLRELAAAVMGSLQGARQKVQSNVLHTPIFRPTPPVQVAREHVLQAVSSREHRD